MKNKIGTDVLRRSRADIMLLLDALLLSPSATLAGLFLFFILKKIKRMRVSVG